MSSGHSQDTKWDVALEDHSQQEWTFTFSNVNKPSQVTNKVTSLIKQKQHATVFCVYIYIYIHVCFCVQDAPLKIKLAVCPSVCQEKILLQGKLKIQRIVTHFKVYDFLTFVCLKAAEKDQESASPVRKLYCADENIERRNHYLDLAGIENYASKFDNMGNNKIIIIKIYFFFSSKHLKT